MKILVVGDGHSAIHEVAVVEAFRKLGHQVEPFYWKSYFDSTNTVMRMWQRAQNKFLVGPILKKLNYNLLDCATRFEPKLIFIYRGTHVTPQTISTIKQNLPDCVVCGYNNDDPFADGHPPWLWRHFLKSVPKYDLVFAYRHHNLDDFIKMGAKRVELLRSWFLPELHKPPNKTVSTYKCDCIFVGHHEDDGRAECLEKLMLNGVSVQLFGPYKGLRQSGWEAPIAKSKILKKLLPVSYLIGMEYVSAIRSSPIALCFLSKLNKDTYTRRCFEIPAIGAALFSEFSDDLASIFIEDKEAVFFRNKEDLVLKVRYYLSHLDELAEIQKRGRERVARDCHDIYSRLDSVIKMVGES